MKKVLIIFVTMFYAHCIFGQKSESIPRVVLHESFTSSTCGPCYQENIALKKIFEQADSEKFALIKYQMNWPSTGDPYFTEEGNTRRNYYGINGVPIMFVEGVRVGEYSVNQINNLAERPAMAKMESFATRQDKTINFNVIITPDSQPNNYLRLFVAIVEKETKNNKKSNGETVFYNVFKKFMTTSNGNTLSSLALGKQTTISLTYQFNGDYRLPSDANSPINHTIEHSVEDFNKLMIVYWIQNFVTKDTWQAGCIEPVETSNVYVKYNVYNDFGIITATAEGENIESGELVEFGSKIIFIATPDNGYKVKNWNINGEIVTDNNTNELVIQSLTSFANVTVEFQENVEILQEGISVPCFTLYPNPTRGELRVENGELKIKSVIVYNVAGQAVMNVSNINSTSYSLNVEKLNSGLYFISVHTKDVVVNGKFVVR